MPLYEIIEEDYGLRLFSSNLESFEPVNLGPYEAAYSGGSGGDTGLCCWREQPFADTDTRGSSVKVL